MPDDIRQGDAISGTIIAEPNGNNARQLEKNLVELVKYTFSIDGNKYAVTDKPATFNWLVHQDRQLTVPLELLYITGTKAHELTMQIKPVGNNKPGSYNCVIPSHALTAAPMRITGNFDGDLSTTKCLLNNQPMDILAESPRQCVVQFPQNAQGPGTVQVNENGESKCERNISGVDMQVTTGKLNLRKGENTYIDVKVTGLQNLPDKALLTITNMTPGVVAITNGNLQVIPIWPPADSAGGTFSLHCPAVSITTGNFSVNINLDLPQPGEETTPATEVPPGYTKKSCQCGASVTVSKTGNGFKAESAPECKGVYGVGINTFTVCSVLSTAYKWTIKSGQENVELIGKTDGPNINVRPKNNDGYSVCVTVTVTCIDGTVCTASTCTDQSGKTVTTPEVPQNPPNSGRCLCAASCEVIAGVSVGLISDFSGKINASCTGSSGSGNTRVQCAVGPITYKWKIGESGKDVAEIDGKSDGGTVKVKRKKDGPYNLYLGGTVTCSDGTVCEFICSAEIPFIPSTNEKVCLPDVKEKAEPKMVGGLKSKQTGTAGSSTIFRDDFIVLEAEGSDIDLVTFLCNPKLPCPDSRSEKTIPVAGKVRFEWEITAGEGRFVKLGCGSEDEKKDKGEHVVFQPPYIPLPVKNADTVFTATIVLSIIDDGSPAADGTVTKTITIKTTRKKLVPDKYTIDITGGAADKLAVPALPAVSGTCELVGPAWKAGDNLAVPVITLPAVADADKMVLGQWLVLKTQDQSDPDDIGFNCSSANCSSSGGGRSYPDNILWEWTIVSGGGKFVLSGNGQYVVYEAPMEMPKGKEVIEVKIKVKVMNPSGVRHDPDKLSKEFTIYIYQPGVRLSHPGIKWLPEENNSLELKSELMYKDRGWKPALAHMCRIHYFELLNVSEEKGVCLNNPVPKEADQCRDLQLKNEKDHEAFDDAKGTGKCDKKELYQQSRTKRPEKEYTITVYSRDFGAYGLLRSFANVNKKTSLEGKPVYISISVKKTDVAHPDGRIKKTEYADNRVTIPYDIDENHIADGGWITQGGVIVPDPVKNNDDEDDKPVGDGFKGDGLSAYEEYRGFRIVDGGAVSHLRTNYKLKDIFVQNEDNLHLKLYGGVSGLQVHEINKDQYVDDKKRVVNQNSNPATHIVDQMGLHLVDKVSHSSLLGIAYSMTGHPAIPNREIEIRIYSGKIAEVCKKRGLAAKLAEKIEAVVAHELLHGNNVCHHGEQNPEVEKSFNLVHGLRSGNVDCVMRYDNVGDIVKGFDPEKIGSGLCDSSAGTGYNAAGKVFGDAATGRGNCKGQIRVSGKGNPPKPCGNR